MDVGTYYKSLATELEALRNRVECFIAGDHWLTVGEANESYLRTVLRRHLPSSVHVGRGFVIAKDDHSTQIDILIYDDRSPRLYWDGDLVFVPPEGVLGIMEVKKTDAEFESAAGKLAANGRLVRRWRGGNDIFSGMFFYECAPSPEQLKNRIEKLRETVEHDPLSIVNHVVLGPSHFIKFWPHPYGDPAGRPEWRGYELRDRAAGYFITNAVQMLTPLQVDENVLYPPEGKEMHRLCSVPFDPSDGPAEPSRRGRRSR